LCALVAPTTNSYKRLVPGFEAPVNLAYSSRNRSAGIRIPMYFTNPQAKRIEVRFPDGSSNPYLAFAAMLMAGLDGIEHKIDPGEPLDKDIYELGPEELKGVPSVPGSLEAALAALERDHDFLLKGDVFTKDMLETGATSSSTGKSMRSACDPIPTSSPSTSMCKVPVAGPVPLTPRATPLLIPRKYVRQVVAFPGG
jgi:glutamine synthetase